MKAWGAVLTGLALCLARTVFLAKEERWMQCLPRDGVNRRNFSHGYLLSVLFSGNVNKSVVFLATGLVGE